MQESVRLYREIGCNFHETIVNECLCPTWGVWEERVSISQQWRWEEGKWAMWRKPEGEWWSVKWYPATFPDLSVGPLCYLDKMGGIKWPAIPQGWVADPLAREESQPYSHLHFSGSICFDFCPLFLTDKPEMPNLSGIEWGEIGRLATWTLEL